MKRSLWALVLTGLLLGGPAAEAVWACPMCKTANESDEDAALRRPRAYMYSILFMLAVPATVFTGFSIGFYRLSKKRQELQNSDRSNDPAGPENDSG